MMDSLGRPLGLLSKFAQDGKQSGSLAALDVIGNISACASEWFHDVADVGAHWPGRAKSTYGQLVRLREDPKQIVGQNIGLTPYAFEVVQTSHTPASFIGRRRFIQDLEAAIERFYANIGRHLSAWSPKAPAPADKTAATEIEEKSVIDSERVRALEQSLALVLELHGRSTNALDGAEDDQAPDGLTRSDGNPLGHS